MKLLLRPLFLLGCVAGFSSGTAATSHVRVSVAAAEVDRAAQVIVFPLPKAASHGSALHGPDGSVVPLQVAADGTATFVVPSQRAGQVLNFTLAGEAPAAPGGGGVTVLRRAEAVEVNVGGAPALVYRMDKEALPRAGIKPEYKRAGYIHPVFTPSGTIVSDDFPVQHVHHHGIWSPWTKTAFQGRTPDFWNMGQKTGTVEFEALDWTWSGPVHGGFVARHRFMDLSAPAPVTALHETWQVTAYQVNGAQVFDLVLTQVCATNDPLVLPQYHYGGLGFRGRGEWFGRDKANFLTSERETNRVKANSQPMRWVHMSGAVERGMAGLAVLGHPANFRAPQPVRVHPTEPFVCFTPSQGGDWQISPGQPYVARYRFVATDGVPEPDQIDAFWNGYALPATVKVTGAP